MSAHPEQSLSHDEIKIIFATRARRFYFLNIAVMILSVSLLLYFREKAYYPWVFFLTTFGLSVWLFFADRFRLCPNCNQSPRGNEGLLRKPAHCASCGIALI